jgi:hypothetical protein
MLFQEGLEPRRQLLLEQLLRRKREGREGG